MNDPKKKKKLPASYGIYLFFVIALYVLIFESPIRKTGFPLAGILIGALPALAVVLFFYRAARGRITLRSLRSPAFLCGALFAAAGLIGWSVTRCQSFPVAFQGMLEHVRFWLCLFFFLQLFLYFPLEQYANRLFLHIGLLSAFFFAATCLDIRFHIWPRQMFRYGTSSIQLFLGHPSELGARAVFLIAMLLILRPHLKPDRKGRPLPAAFNTVLTFALLGVVVMTLRVRLFGFVLVFLALFVWMIVFSRRLILPVVLIGTAGALFLGGQRLYDYYFSPYAFTMARGQLAIHSLELAMQNMPFGGGFGTFGSRTAQIHYSPLYYQFGMMTTPGLSPKHPNFACDAFFPSILGETGWLGLAAYVGLLVCLAVTILRCNHRAGSDRAKLYPCLAALSLFVFELLETTGTLAFSERYSVLIAAAVSLALVQFRRNGPASSG